MTLVNDFGLDLDLALNLCSDFVLALDLILGLILRVYLFFGLWRL